MHFKIYGLYILAWETINFSNSCKIIFFVSIIVFKLVARNYFILYLHFFKMNQSKPRIIKDYEKLDPEIQEQIKLVYPYGFSHHLVSFTNKDGKYVSALPFETDEKYYLIRMTVREAEILIEQDDDYDFDGSLKDSVKEDYENKYSDLEYLTDQIEDEKDEFPDDDDIDI